MQDDMTENSHQTLCVRFRLNAQDTHMIPLFTGSLIPNPPGIAPMVNALRNERRDLVNLLVDVLRDLDAVIPQEITRREIEACVRIVSAPASHDPNVLREDCRVLMNAAIAVMDDPTIRFTTCDVLNRAREITDRRSVNTRS